MDSNFKIHVPVLLIAFNRPEVLNKTIQYIHNAKPQKLYVAIDGPREYIEGESELVNQVRQIVQNINWPCESHYKFNETNKGAEVTISSALAWVFEKEEHAIILEDDIIAPMSFLRFAQEMLVKYKDYKKIGMVTGCNFTPIDLPGNADYFFTKYGHSGGWATWKRAWKKFDLNVDIPEEHQKLPFLRTITNTPAEARYFQKRFIKIKQKGQGNNTWDTIWMYTQRTNNYLSVIPRVNLTSNIGVQGLHANGKTIHHFRRFDENFTVVNYPNKIECNIQYDKFHFRNYMNKKKAFYKRVYKKLLKLMFFNK